jgi:hypothetical protein
MVEHIIATGKISWQHLVPPLKHRLVRPIALTQCEMRQMGVSILETVENLVLAQVNVFYVIVVVVALYQRKIWLVGYNMCLI